MCTANNSSYVHTKITNWYYNKDTNIVNMLKNMIDICCNYPLCLYFLLFSRDVALLFNWKYFGVEISCGRYADDMQTTREQDFGRDFTGRQHMSFATCLHVIHMLSARHPEVCMSSARDGNSSA